MSRRYTYSRMIVTDEGSETFTAQEFDSFDEAQTAVEKGIYNRRLQLKEREEAKKVEVTPPEPKNEETLNPPTVPDPANKPE